MREIRLEYENAWYHVMNRAAGKRFVFSDENNKYIFFELINEVYKKHAIEIHAYCLMDNHYHLLVKTPNANLSKAMHHLQFRFSKIYNKIINSDGPIFRSRYKSILIKNDAYLAQVCRYIHLNPVEAKIASGIQYTWSSYNHYINPLKKPYWLITDILMEIITNNFDKFSFIDFHKENNSVAIESFYEKNNTKEFIELDLENIPIDLNKLFYLVNNIIRNKQPSLSRFIFCFLAKNIYNYSLKDISDSLGCLSKNSIAVLLSRNKSKVNSDLILTLNGLSSAPDVLITNLYKALQ